VQRLVLTDYSDEKTSAFSRRKRCRMRSSSSPREGKLPREPHDRTKALKKLRNEMENEHQRKKKRVRPFFGLLDMGRSAFGEAQMVLEASQSHNVVALKAPER
jgi:hypothetical protein